MKGASQYVGLKPRLLNAQSRIKNEIRIYMYVKKCIENQLPGYISLPVG